jgi:1,4-dihydroxy-2-naphthoate octaprenyltransferase
MGTLRISRSPNIVITLLTYSLGTGIARYLGTAIQWPIFFLGLFIILPLVTASSFLVEYFNPPLTTYLCKVSSRKIKQYKGWLLLIAFALLATSCVSVISLLLISAINPFAGIFLISITIIMLVYAIPPIELSKSGYGELALSFIFATLIPGISYLFQTDDIHRILPIITFPLTLQAIAWQLAANFSTYAIDQKSGRQSLVIRLSWQKAVPVHHVLILTAFLFYITSPFFGVSWALVWPILLALPFAILQIVWLQRIANGGRPVWKFYNVLIPTVFGLSIYLIGISFWLR